ncbi:MAG: GNAT family N-acetyltransferase [Myxococcales bacterium]|nr:GNAT family N-acetyltransferase [Myxococcales bacterium]
MTYGPLREDQLPIVSDILAAAFATPPEQIGPWLDRTGHDHVRVLADGGRPVACLLELPMAHFFLGKRVPTVGIAGVGVALEARGQGAGRRLMDKAILEIAEQGVALSTLYPATQTLYRRSGYERSGKLLEVRVPTFALDLEHPRDRSIEVRPLGEGDRSAVESLYTELAREQHGYLDRNEYMWSRVRAPQGKPARGFGFFAGEALEGYLYMRTQESDSPPHHDVRLTDLVGGTARALRAMLRFFHDQRSLTEHVTFRTGPEVPILSVLPEHRYDQELVLDWMVRVTRVESALALRGYPESADMTLELDVRDDLVEANAGRWTLHLKDGEAEVGRGGRGTVALDVRALAPLYTGYLSAASMRRLGWLDASDEAVRALDEVFRSPMPGMGEMF